MRCYLNKKWEILCRPYCYFMVPLLSPHAPEGRGCAVLASCPDAALRVLREPSEDGFEMCLLISNVSPRKARLIGREGADKCWLCRERNF